MKTILTTALILSGLAALPTAAQAQGPVIDPSFGPVEIRAEGGVVQALQQADGKLLLTTDLRAKVNGTAAPGVARLNAGSNQLDLAFQANVSGLQADISPLAALLPGNKTLLYSLYSRPVMFRLGSVQRTQLLVLNADGTPDAGFNAGTGPAGAGLVVAVAQPDGKVLVGGSFTQFDGRPATHLVRLDATGAVDAAFSAALGTGFDGPVTRLLVQADGCVVVAGDFGTVRGQPRRGLARLLPTGAPDPAFAPPLPTGFEIAGLDQQPDGKLLVCSENLRLGGVFGSAWRPLERLLPNGTRDPAFVTGTNFPGGFRPHPFNEPPVRALPGGGMVVWATAGAYNGIPVSNLIRLTDAGALDPSFPNATSVAAAVPVVYSAYGALTLLDNGQKVVVGGALRWAPDQTFSGPPIFDVNTGLRLRGLAPRVTYPGEVWDAALQPDGKLVVVGTFTEINNQPAPCVARLLPNGQLDPSFTARTNDRAAAVAIQPDGKVVVGGYFSYAQNQPRNGLARFEADGTLDTGFDWPPSWQNNIVQKVAIQPNGNVLVTGGVYTDFVSPIRPLASLLGTTGALDPAFLLNQNRPGGIQPLGFVVQPDGRLVLNVGFGIAGSVRRFLPNGAADPTFTTFALPLLTGNESVYAMARDPATGAIYADAGYSATGITNTWVRLRADGTLDPAFNVPAATFGSGSEALVNSMVVQPNGRLLLGGYFPTGPQTWVGSWRLLPDGTTDASYNAAAGPNGGVNKVLVQPDGAIVMAGSFDKVGGRPFGGLVRLLDPNVLGMSAGRPAARARLAAWPVPAHEQLQVRLTDPTARPVRLALLDALGRVVLAQLLAAATHDLTLNTTALPPGTYVLQVQYASGAPAVQRVVLE